MYRNTYVEIDTNKIKNNIKNIISYYNDYKYYIGVVKANAYGYGEEVVKYMSDAGINYFAVSNLDEALSVRKYTNKPILCLEPIPFKYIDIIKKNNITITLSNYDDYKELLKFDIADLKIHLKIDSGMNRLGFTDKVVIKEVYDKLSSNIEGIYTHMATSGINDKKFDNQIDKFTELTSLIDLSKIDIVHIGRSATLVNHKKYDFVNGTRIGILMYGIPNNDIVFSGFKGKLREAKRNKRIKQLNISQTNLVCPVKVEQSFKLISEIIEIKSISANEFVGYGLSNKVESDSLIGIVPVGYADGFDIRNTGSSVKINNKLYQIIGSVNSGMIIIKIDDSVKLHDKVEVIYDVVKTSKYTNQTVYTVTSSINSNILRIYK